MKGKEPKKKLIPAAALEEELLAGVSGGTADTEAEVQIAFIPPSEETVQTVTGSVGAIVAE